MSAQQPSELHELFKKFFDARDMDGMLSIYEPDAVMSSPTGDPSAGHAALKEGFQLMFSFEGTTIDFVGDDKSFVVGDLALVHGKWHMKSADGGVIMEASTAEIARRGADGLWRYVIDNPFGTAILDT
jgi:ketosteroid isomerase-like protein